MNKNDLLKLIGEVLSEDYMDEPSKEITPAYKSRNKKYSYIYATGTCSFLKDGNGSIWVFEREGIPNEEFASYIDRDISYKGKSEDETEYEDIDFTPETFTSDVIEGYVNSMISNADKGEGLTDFENGTPLVKVDSELADYLLNDVFKGEKGLLYRVLTPLIKEDANTKLKNFIVKEIKSMMKDSPILYPDGWKELDGIMMKHQ
jgi:hypothetical protein